MSVIRQLVVLQGWSLSEVPLYIVIGSINSIGSYGVLQINLKAHHIIFKRICAS